VIFIRGVSAYTQKSDLVDFVSPALVNRLRFVNGKILEIEVLTLYDRKKKLIEFHGLVTVNSEKAGKLAIKKLHGSVFQGRRVVVREYIKRSWQNDRRHNHAEKFDSLFSTEGKRRGDRRRDLEKIQSISHMFTARLHDSRKLI